MESALIWLLAAGVAWGTLLSARRLIHYFQLESYQFPGYFRTVWRNLLRAMMPGVVMTVTASALLYVLLQLVPSAKGWMVIVLTFAHFLGMLIGGFWWGALERTPPAKKPLVVTPRVKRLFVTAAILFPLVAYGSQALIGTLWGMVLFPLFLPLWVALAGLLAWPVEKLVSELYFRDAQRILNQVSGLIRIGITGSYGKTSVKAILNTLLSEKYQTLVTRESFNTPMGVTREIREKLLPTHQVFVAEMGARHVGDIRELVRLVHPTIGVISSVGPQHLDTFHTLERIRRTKYELIDGLPADGVAFFPDDGGICLEYYHRTDKHKVLAAVHGDHHPDVWAEDIQADRQGSTFLLCTADQRIPCQTRLLGMHNIQNVVLAASVALHLGISMAAVARGIGKLQPVTHRLELLPDRGGITVIDDAFNSNPKGAEAALQVLKGFSGKRIIVTPGMVELGKDEATHNRQFGQSMAACVDVAILVGKKHTQPIVAGLQDAGFPQDHLHVVSSLDEARLLLGKIAAPGDVVLFENDLPDNY